MSDITANLVIGMPAQLFTLARSFKANANGKIYIGQPDTDPTNPANQIQVYVENEDGSHMPVPQPIIINAGGFPVLGGQIKKFVTVQNYSMSIYDAYNAQQFYFEDVAKYDPDQFSKRLASTSDGEGDELVGVKQPFSGAKGRTQHDKNAEFVTLFDFPNIAGDGIADDTAGIAVIEALSSAPVIYGLGATYKVDAVPTSKRYSDGWWLVNGSRIPFDFVSIVRASQKVIALGPNAALAANGARNQIAIGEDALRSNVAGRHNIALGISALHYLNGIDASSISASRNIAIGGNAGRFLSTGSRNIIMGRDAGHNLTDAHLNVIIGVASVMGDGPNTLDPGVIENQTPLTPSYGVVMGAEAGKYWNAGYGVLLGYQSGLNVKSDTGIVAIGPMAFSLHQSDMSYWGTTQQLVSLTGTYSQSGGKTITVSTTAHGMSTGFRVLMRFTTGANADVTFQDDNWFVVTVIDANTFTIQSPVNATASGNVSISKIATTTPYSANTGGCVGIGREVGNGTSNYRSTGVGDRIGAKGLGVENSGLGYKIWVNYVPGAGCTAAGAYSQQSNNNAGGNTSFGILTMAGNVLTGVSNSAFGPQAMRFVSTGSNNAAFGGNALRGLTTGSYNSAMGTDALRYIFGSANLDHNFSNCSGLGYQAYCSGDNQVQLGNSVTTTYAWGAVQQRSDERDKYDKREIPGELAVAFVRGLESCFYKLDYRDDYFEEYTVQVGIDENAQPVFETRRRAIPRDGSKKRKRDHAGYLAQQVKALMDRLGIDFGMYQDHLVNGGEDVKTLGYEQAIPFVTKALDVAFARMDKFEERLSKIETKEEKI
ncbi:hypothetical protein F2M41_17325 [Escherichia coli]|nr:hypothetical protein [Escherichia coli]